MPGRETTRSLADLREEMRAVARGEGSASPLAQRAQASIAPLITDTITTVREMVSTTLETHDYARQGDAWIIDPSPSDRAPS